jgi:cytochrome c biogenesis protein CcmG/thiol:disulfide interchange protein DsbE
MNSYRFKQQIVISIVILLAGAAWIWASRVNSYTKFPNQSPAPQQGFTAPDFSLSSISGTEISLSDFSGKAVVLNFWASWCPPCRSEMPAFNQVFTEYQNQDLAILAINATDQDSTQSAVDFVESNKLTFYILFDHSGEVGNLYNIYSLPTTFFIDKDRIIQKVLIGGPLPIALLRVEIEKLLESSK